MKFVKLMVLVCACSFGVAFGEIEVKPDSKSFTFSGQGEEILDLVSETIEHKMVEESYQDTCVRKVPYTENVCRNVTEYDEVNCRMTKPETVCENVPRQECETRYEEVCENRTEPVCTDVPREVCENRSSPVCESVTRYREECHNETDRECSNHPRQVCETRTTTREECRTVPGEPTCEIVNGRRICRPGQGQRVCEQVPHQEQVCETRNEQSCRDVTRRECRQVPYQDQECHNETRRVCETRNEQSCRNVTRRECSQEPRQSCHTEYERECRTIPSERVCDRVPRTRKVCEDVIRERKETYACTKTRQVPKSEVIKKDHAKLIFSFVMVGPIAEDVEVGAVLTGDKLKLQAKSESDLIVLAIDKVESEGEDKVHKITLKIMSKKEIIAPFEQEISTLKYKKGKLSFLMGKISVFESLLMRVSIKHHEKELLDRLFKKGEFEMSDVEGEEGRVKVSIDVKALGAKLAPFFKKYDVKISIRPALIGEVISGQANFKERVFEGNL